jgi:hypothetical protein
VFAIYHIPGKKVGCTRDINVRRRWYPKGTVLEVLEILPEESSPQEAGDKEWEWADRLGYERGGHYTDSPFVGASIEDRRAWSKKGRKIGGKRRMERMTPEERSALGRYGSKQRLETMTPEQRKEFARKGGKIGNKIGKSNGGKIGGKRTVELRTGAQFQRGTCPHCGIETNLPLLHQWHGDSCKKKRQQLRRPG